jgi:hypothetical protein
MGIGLECGHIAGYLAVYHDFVSGDQKPWWIIVAGATSKDRVLFVVAQVHETKVRLFIYSNCSAMQVDDAEYLSQLRGKQII